MCIRDSTPGRPPGNEFEELRKRVSLQTIKVRENLTLGPKVGWCWGVVKGSGGLGWCMRPWTCEIGPVWFLEDFRPVSLVALCVLSTLYLRDAIRIQRCLTGCYYILLIGWHLGVHGKLPLDFWFCHVEVCIDFSKTLLCYGSLCFVKGFWPIFLELDSELL